MLLAALGVLVLIGVLSSFARTLFLEDLVARFDPARQQLFQSLGLEDPRASERTRTIERFDERFADHPVLTLMHIIPGSLFLVLGLTQFMTGGRTRFRRLHPWIGRLLVADGVFIAASGLYFGVVIPVAGVGESAAIVAVSALFLFALARALGAIRAGKPDAHREWMIRAFAVCLGISVVRVFGAGLDLALTPRGVSIEAVFVLSLWIGWLVTLGAAEALIRTTRAADRSNSLQVPTAWSVKRIQVGSLDTRSSSTRTPDDLDWR